MKLNDGKTAPRALWEPDFERIANGDPFSTDGMGQDEKIRLCRPCPAPIETERGARFEKPEGPWELRAGPGGRLFWVHAEFHRRSLLPCFQRRVRTEEEAQQSRNRMQFGGRAAE